MPSNVVKEAYNEIKAGNYMSAVRLLEKEDLNHPEVLSNMGIAFFYMGRYEEAYTTYHKLFSDESVKRDEVDCAWEAYDEAGQGILDSLTKLGVPKLMEQLPKEMDFGYPQSKETPKENYDEVVEFQAFLNKCKGMSHGNIKQASKYISDGIEAMLNSKHPVIVAKAWFYKAELCYRQKDYLEAYKCYLKAAVTEQSKALYYGYAANMLMKLEKDNFNGLAMASVLNMRAEELNIDNAKWHYNQALILTSLSRTFSEDGSENRSMLLAARKELAFAYEMLREEQVQLKQLVEKTYEDVKGMIY